MLNGKLPIVASVERVMGALHRAPGARRLPPGSSRRPSDLPDLLKMASPLLLLRSWDKKDCQARGGRAAVL